MKFKSIGRIALAMGMSLAVGLGTTSCSRDYVVAYVYATSAQNASVSGFAVDYQTGVLTQIAGSPFTAGVGRNPVFITSSPNGQNVYVVNHDDSTITEFAVGTDGKLYGQNTYNVPNLGTYPTSAAIDSTGSYLYVTFTYQNGFGPNTPGPGGVAIFPIKSDGTLGTGSTVAVGNSPVALAVSNPVCSTNPLSSANASCTGNNGSGKTNVFVYVADQQTSTTGTVLGFYQNSTTGALTPLSATGYTAGIAPSSIAIDPTTTYAYVTDKSANLIYGYRIANNTSGNLTPLSTSPYTTGLYPVSVTIDPRGKYLLTANYNANTVSSFSLNISDGSLGGSAGGSVQVGTGPTCVNVESALGIYAFTSDSINNTLSGLQLSANTGGLSLVPNTPFSTGTLPSCVTSVANGSHAQSVVNP